jgi:predicted Fe-Mo cluster-binding NifX family protein
MKIAVSSQNFRTITGHGGKSRRFLIFEADGSAAPKEIDRLDLPMDMSLHDYHGADHPLFQAGVDVVITGSCGNGFVQRLGRQGIRVFATAATDPADAAAMVAAGQDLPPAAPHQH